MIGGGVVALRWRGLNMLRPASQAALEARDPTGLSEFPLAPFANRIAHGRFRWQGQHNAIDRPTQGGAHALHGHAWLQPWRVEAQAEDRLTMALDAPACTAWPWAVRMRRAFVVEEAGAVFTLSLTALGPEPMPAGLGFHPYFPSADAQVRMAASHQIETTADLLPRRFSQTPICAGMAHGAQVSALNLDHAFAGWDGRARIVWPDRAVTLIADQGLQFAHVYAPQGEGFFCVEPVSAMPDAVNWQGAEHTGLRTLASGETFTVSMRLAFDAATAARPRQPDAR